MQNEAHATIRILETTDLHMQLLGYDYFADQPTPGIGLIPLAAKIESLRS
ncbi:MAG: 2',3'-cyclic-nucleotide 2'-phosphodiesterase/3'-nucleotidase, partial [Yoonia sp.]